MPGNDPLTKLQSVMRLAYGMRSDEEAVLARNIENHMQAAWTEQMRSEARSVGSKKSIPFPRGEALDMIRRQAITDAHSIRNTYNRGLEREIRRLYDANPRGNRNYYMKNIEDWHAKWQAWKDRQIALVNDKTARYMATQEFNTANDVQGARYVFDGPAPACDDCGAMFAAGEVNQDFVDRNPTPLHPNCPHYWTRVGGRVGVPIEQLWVG